MVPIFSPIIAGAEILVRDHDYTEKEKCSLDLSEEKLLALGNYLNVCNLDLDTFVNHSITILYMWATFKKSRNYDFWYVEVTFDEGGSLDDPRMKFRKLDTMERLAN